MSYAFCLRLDAESEAAVAALWQVLVDSGAGDEMVRLGYPPHLSLAVLDEEPDRAVVERAFGAMRDEVALPATLGGASCFGGTTIAWLAVDGGDALMNLHQGLLARLPATLVRSHYRVGLWTPHVTLQLTGDVDRALVIAGTMWTKARSARFVGLDLVQFPPIHVLESMPL